MGRSPTVLSGVAHVRYAWAGLRPCSPVLHTLDALGPVLGTLGPVSDRALRCCACQVRLGRSPTVPSPTRQPEPVSPSGRLCTDRQNQSGSVGDRPQRNPGGHSEILAATAKSWRPQRNPGGHSEATPATCHLTASPSPSSARAAGRDRNHACARGASPKAGQG